NADGMVVTLAGHAGKFAFADGSGSDARFSSISGLTVEPAGTVYVADNNTIRKEKLTGEGTNLAGMPDQQGRAEGVGSAARFNQPSSVAVDAAGFLYVADALNRTIRKVTPAGDVTTLAGLAGRIGNEDGMGSEARFFFPLAVGVDRVGNVYVLDQL